MANKTFIPICLFRYTEIVIRKNPLIFPMSGFFCTIENLNMEQNPSLSTLAI